MILLAPFSTKALLSYVTSLRNTSPPHRLPAATVAHEHTVSTASTAAMVMTLEVVDRWLRLGVGTQRSLSLTLVVCYIPMKEIFKGIVDMEYFYW